MTSSGWRHVRDSGWRHRYVALAGFSPDHGRLTNNEIDQSAKPCGIVSAMQVGVVYPQTELRGDPAALRRFGTAVEHLGFAHGARTNPSRSDF